MNDVETIREFVIGTFLLGDGARLANDTSFMESGIVDSTGMLEIVGFLEEKFGIVLRDDELLPENLDSLNNLARFIAARRGQ